MTKEEAIRNFREHWASLAITGTDDKRDYLRRHGFQNISCDCFLCEYATNGMEKDCNKCPIEWPETRTDMEEYACSRSFYGDWERAESPEERKRLAAIIRDLPEKQEVKLKPKFSVGDKVKAVKETSCWGKVKPGDIGVITKVLDGLYVADFPAQKSWHGKEECFELATSINHCPEDKTVTVQTITIEFKGPKTICTIENQFGTFKGRAKCHPTNQWNEKTGADLPLERAVEKFNEYQPDV